MSSLDALHQLAVSASEVHAANQRSKPNNKIRGGVEIKSEEERARKRQLRLLKNRQSAALSRQRKKEYITDLEVRAGSLGSDKSTLEYKVTTLTTITLEYKLQLERLEKQLKEVTQENCELKAKLLLLTEQKNFNNNHNNNSISNNNSNPPNNFVLNNINKNNNNIENNKESTIIPPPSPSFPTPSSCTTTSMTP